MIIPEPVGKDIANVLSSGSSGNCEIYHRSIMVDIGVPYSIVKQYENDIQIVLLTHVHKDHIHIDTLQRLCRNRPTIRIGCGRWMLELLEGFKNVDVFDFGKWYNYGTFRLAIGKLYHDVPNCFYRIDKAGYKIFHATDTCTLDGIEAKNYDLYAVEHNYNEETIMQVIAEIEARGEYAHQRGSINSHLSEQQARDFIYKNRAEHSKVIRLHESNSAI